MPKIDVNEELFFKTLGRRLEKPALVELLTVAKAELDDWPAGEGVLRIELNDTNRPDLWSTLGLARQLSIYLTGTVPAYPFFSRSGDVKKTGERRVVVDAGLKDIRPYIGSFVAEIIEIRHFSSKNTIIIATARSEMPDFFIPGSLSLKF